MAIPSFDPDCMVTLLKQSDLSPYHNASLREELILFSVFFKTTITAWISVCYVAIICFTISYDFFLILVIPVESCRLRWS